MLSNIKNNVIKFFTKKSLQNPELVKIFVDKCLEHPEFTQKLLEKYFQNDESAKYKSEIEVIKKSFIIGKTDDMGNKITKVFVTGDNYTVYEIETDIVSESLRTYVHPKTQEDIDGVEKLFDGIRVKYSQIKGQLYKANDDTSIKSQIAHIISHALNGNVDNANQSFDSLITKIDLEYRAQLRHRAAYLIMTILMVLSLIIASAFIYYNHLFIKYLQIRDLVFVSTAASIGGYISVSRKIKSTVFEKEARSWLFILYSIERVFISIIAGIISYAVITCNLAFGIVAKLDKPIWGLILFAIVAGFSETLIPSLLTRLENEGK